MLEDKRQSSKVDHPLLEILFLSLVAVAGRASNWKEIEFFGKSHISVLQEYYPFANGVPSDDTVRRTFEILDPDRLNEVLRKYFTVDLTGEHVSIDGKALRGSARSGVRALHFLNVYAAESGITLFGKAIDAKNNEITALPEAIDVLDIKGAIVTIDAMGCQRSIAAQIKKKGGDYILGLKGNQVALYNEVKTAFESKAETFFKMESARTLEKGHGRIEERSCRVIRDFAKIPSSSNWQGLSSVIEIKRKTTIKDKITETTNYYISSSMQKPEQMMKSIRSHWGIESIHWVLDVVFKEDASLMHKGNIPANMAITRRFVLNILGQMKQKGETKPMLMNGIGWSQDYLRKFIQKLIKGS
jgi:predicted transposase YbfD/YdcC